MKKKAIYDTENNALCAYLVLWIPLLCHIFEINVLHAKQTVRAEQINENKKNRKQTKSTKSPPLLAYVRLLTFVKGWCSYGAVNAATKPTPQSN